MDTLAGRIKTFGEFSSVRYHAFRNNSSSFATLAAIRLADQNNFLSQKSRV
jgi:hypothetical protein